MAANSKTSINKDLEDMKNLAIEQQQCFYELLSDCTTYQPHEHKYLKQNIGYALYGPPKDNKDTESNVYCNAENQSEDSDIADAVDYKDTALAVINKIYEKICEFTIGTNSDKPIYFAIIYNVAICPKDKSFQAISIPIFKIWREKKIKEKKTGRGIYVSANQDQCEIWYIDTTGRIYKDWTDYKTKNNLFKCTMVLPKDGLYQPDPSCPITEDYSTVLLEIMDSPACSLETLICNGVDTASTLTGAGAVAVSVASLVTPLAPVVIIGGIITTGVTAAWTMARSAQRLIDRNTHEESINPLNPEAFPQWLTITGSAFGLGAMGGAVAMSTAISRGMAVNTAARLAFNTVQGGNIFFNGIGIIYQGYCIVDRYMTDQTFSYLDIISLATHFMFFAGTVVNVQFAGDMIKSNQGKILNDYRDNIQSKRLRRRFNQVKRKAIANNTNEISQNAEVIRYIRRRNQLVSDVNMPSTSANINQLTNNDNTPSTSANTNQFTNNINSNMIKWSINNGSLKVNGVTLLDPLVFITILVREMSTDFNQDNRSDSQIYENDVGTTTLWSFFDNLVSQYNSNNSGSRINTSEFIPLFREMDTLNVNQNLLEKMFRIAMRLLEHSKNTLDFLRKAMKFIWLYSKKNFKRWGIETCLRMQSIAGFKILRIIITALFEAEKLDNLYLAFEKYLLLKIA